MWRLILGSSSTAEKYLREVWGSVTSALKEHGVACELNLVRMPPANPLFAMCGRPGQLSACSASVAGILFP